LAKRVFHVAKELGVKSKEIVIRCQEEGIPGIENHMSTVLAGLEATIHEWFEDSCQDDSSDVEVSEESAAPSAVATALKTEKKAAKKKAAKKKAAKKKAVKKKVAKKPAKKVAKKVTKKVTKKVEEAEEPAKKETTEAPKDDAGVATAVAEPPVDGAEPVGDGSFGVSDDPDVKESDGALSAAADAGADGPSAEVGADDKVPEESARPMSKAVPNVPVRPDAIVPAGPKLDVSTPAQLSGPKVVRVEKAETIESPRKRPRQDTQSPGGRGAIGGPPPTEGPIRQGGGGSSRRNVRRKTRGRGDGRSAQSGRFDESSNQSWRAQDLLERERRLSGSHGYIKMIRRESKKREQGQGPRAKTARETGGVVKIEEPFSIKDLSAVTGVKASEILATLFKKGIMTNINAGIDTETAMDVMFEWGIELEVAEQKTAEDVVVDLFKERESTDSRHRAPVVTILGHVDHGKTSLLDRIRHANVAEGEAGGITQHTSSFRVQVRAGDEEKEVVFLDTPGHEAFTSMRARGAQVTDIVVLVVAADDGVMPQTVESIAHAKAAEVPIVVALNKTDKPEATTENIQRIFAQLAEHELSPVEWGGSTELVRCSAIKNEGIQDLLDAIDFQAELMELTADFAGPAQGHVLEAKMVEGRGAVASALVRDGVLHIGDFIVSGRGFGRVRDMTNDRGERLKEAGPSTPIEISGLNTLPDAGDAFYIVDSLKVAEEAAEQRRTLEREKELATPKVTLDNIFSQISETERVDMNLIVKGDAQGSIETIKKSLEEISTDELNIRVLHSAVGGISESDILLAEASNAIVLGFHVIAPSSARSLAEQKGVEIRIYHVIYELLDEVKKAAAGLLAPEIREEVLGHCEVRQVFRISKVGLIAGCYVTDGTVERNAKIRVTRDGIVVENDRMLEQLKRFKEDAKVVHAGQECGMKVGGYDDIKEDDVIECYKTTEVAREL